MALSVSTANPQSISGVGVATPGQIAGVGVANPGTLTNLQRTQQNVATNQAGVNASVQANNQLQAQLQSLYASLRPVSPANVDVAAINAQARRQAEESVNPLYTKKLNDMLAREAVKRQRAQEDYNTNLQSITDMLQQAQAGNALNRERTAEDVATNVGQLNTAEDRFQTASGQQFEDQRLAQAGELAASGLTTSGIGQQQTQRAIDERNTGEKQQTEDFQAQRASQAVLKARTFEDLGRSDVLAGQKAEKGKVAEKVNLDRLIEDVNSEESAGRFDIEQQRLGDIASQSNNYAKLNFNNYLAGIRDPRSLAATAQAYGGLF